MQPMLAQRRTGGEKMKRLAFILIVVLVAGMVSVACCPRNPWPDSVKTAHGNTDWHIDTAEEFLTGKNMGGVVTAANHVPDTWNKTHMHVNETNTNIYYYDMDITPTGNDKDVSKGIDNPMLFFYAGHGGPTSFSTLGNSASMSNMKLGNCNKENKGTLRYYWQCSCEVFAHGPQICSGTTEAYACPQDFDGSADSATMRNVFERWGPVLDSNLRLACGSSTLAFCHTWETNKIWDNYNNKGYDVADAFIDGLHTKDWNTPLCITTGGVSIGTTPLFDSTFTNAPNPSGDYLHIQYLSNFESTVPEVPLKGIPDLIPIFELKNPPLPDPYRKYKFEEKGEWSFSKEKLDKRGVPVVRVNQNSGAIYLSGEKRFDEKAKPLDEAEYLERAQNLVKEQGWDEKEVRAPTGMRMMIDRSLKGRKASDLARVQKNAMITFRRQVSVEGNKVDVLGEGGKISIQLNNDGTLLNASKVWREIVQVKQWTRSKSFDRALAEAQARFDKELLNAYKLEDWTWGYEEEAGNVKQEFLKAVYVFNFFPKDPRRTFDYPPRIVKVSAHLE